MNYLLCSLLLERERLRKRLLGNIEDSGTKVTVKVLNPTYRQMPSFTARVPEVQTKVSAVDTLTERRSLPSKEFYFEPVIYNQEPIAHGKQVGYISAPVR